MAKVKSAGNKEKRIRPALTPEAREGQLISLAIDLAEKQLLEGTASSQVITHYLKLGSMMQKEEMESKRLENELTKAKIEAYQSAKRVEELYANALNAFRSYGGGSKDDE